MKGILPTSHYLPTPAELPHIEKPWKEMQWGKKNNEKEKDDPLVITSAKHFIAADQRHSYQKELEDARNELKKLESDLNNPDSTFTDKDRAWILNFAIPDQRAYIKSIEGILKDFSEKGEKYKEYIEYSAFSEAQISVTISYSTNIKALWESYVTTIFQSMAGLKKLDLGDDGRILNQENSTLLYFVRGDFFVFVHAAGHPKFAKKIGELIESKLAMILLVKVIQVIDAEDIPLISGKKLGVYVAVEAQEEFLTSNNYILSLKVGKGNFLRNEYPIPLNAVTPVEFDPIPHVNDGGTWDKEVAEPVKKSEMTTCMEYFNLRKPGKGKRIKFFRFFLKPTNPNFNRHYLFRVDIIDEEKTKLASIPAEKKTLPSTTLKIAVVPVKVGYWAPPKDWLERAVEIEGKTPRDYPDNHLHVWTDLAYTQFLESLTEKQRKIITPIERWIKRAFQSGEGKRAYTTSAKRLAHFARAVFPLAEENFIIDIKEDFPPDLNVTPHESSIENIAEKLDKWAKKNSYDRVVGIVPGSKNGMGGVSFDINGIGVYTWWYGKTGVIVSLQAPAYVGAHELAHTYGAVDEYLGSLSQPLQVKLRGQTILNSALGDDHGEQVKHGFWAARKEFMGTSKNPKDSIMGKAANNPLHWMVTTSSTPDAWIGPTLYRGFLQVFYQWTKD